MLSFTKEQEDLRRFVREFADERIDLEKVREADQDRRFPIELWDALSEAGLHGLAVPADFGGAAAGLIEQTIVEEELARKLGGIVTAWSINTHSAQTISRHGTEKHKSEILPAIAEGKHRIALSFTEPGGGTDVLGALNTKARKEGDHWVINGSKQYTTMIADCQHVMVLVRSNEDGRKHDGLSIFLIPTDRKGISWQRIPTLGQESIGTYTVFYDSVEVTEEDLIGEIDKGWECFAGTINHERVIIAAACMGTLKGIIEISVAYAKERQAFGGPIGRFQALQHYIAEMEMSYRASRLMTYEAAGLEKEGKAFGMEASVAKAFASEACSRGGDLGIQILGGAGYSKVHDIERMWRDTRIMKIGPISNEMVKNYVAEGLGLPRSF
jgi:acyl-CoA dehydrogenase